MGKNANRIMGEITAEERIRLEATGIAVVNQVKPRTPVDKGLLRAGQTYEVGPGWVRIGNNKVYGPHVELGTSKMAAQPHLVPGLKAAIPEIIAIWSA